MHRVAKSELSDIFRDLELPRNKAEVLTSRLRNWNFLANTIRVSTFRQRQKPLERYFSTTDELTYCTDVQGLMEELNITYKSED